MVVAEAGLLENRRAPATTLEGWRSFISADPSELALLPAGQWEALGERDRRDYDEARIAHHAELVVVTTSAIAEITAEGQLPTSSGSPHAACRRTAPAAAPRHDAPASRPMAKWVRSTGRPAPATIQGPAIQPELAHDSGLVAVTSR